MFRSILIHYKMCSIYIYLKVKIIAVDTTHSYSWTGLLKMCVTGLALLPLDFAFDLLLRGPAPSFVVLLHVHQLGDNLALVTARVVAVGVLFSFPLRSLLPCIGILANVRYDTADTVSTS